MLIGATLLALKGFIRIVLFGFARDAATIVILVIKPDFA